MTRDKKKFFGNGPSGLIILVAVFVVGVVLLSTLTEVSSTIVHLSTTDFYEYVEQGKIDSVFVSGQDVVGKLKDDKKFQARVPHDEQLVDKLRKHGVKGDFAPG